MKMVLWCTTTLLSLLLGATLFVHAARDLKSMVDGGESGAEVGYWETRLHGASMPASIRALLSPLTSSQTTQFLTSINATPGYLPAHAAPFCEAAHIQCGGFFFDGQLRKDFKAQGMPETTDRPMFPLFYLKAQGMPETADRPMFPLFYLKAQGMPETTQGMPETADRPMFPLFYLKAQGMPETAQAMPETAHHPMFPLFYSKAQGMPETTDHPMFPLFYLKVQGMPETVQATTDHPMFPLFYSKAQGMPETADRPMFPLFYLKAQGMPETAQAMPETTDHPMFPLFYSKAQGMPETVDRPMFPLFYLKAQGMPEPETTDHPMFPLFYSKTQGVDRPMFPLFYLKAQGMPETAQAMPATTDHPMFPLFYSKAQGMPETTQGMPETADRPMFPLFYLKVQGMPETAQAMPEMTDHPMFPLFYSKAQGIPETVDHTMEDTKATRLLMTGDVQEVPGFFFREKQVLVNGVKIHVNLAGPPTNGGRLDERAFLPRELAKLFSLATRGSELSNMLEVSNDYVQNTINACNANKEMNEEVSACLSSVEDLADFVSSVVGSTKHINAYDFVWNASNENSTEKTFIVKNVKKLKLDVDEPSLTCHDMPFPFRLFYCHYVKNTMVFAITLEGEDGSTHQRIAMCHYNTSYWNPQHVSFAELSTKPGEAEACHFSGKTWMGNSGWVFMHA